MSQHALTIKDLNEYLSQHKKAYNSADTKPYIAVSMEEYNRAKKNPEKWWKEKGRFLAR